MSKSRAKTRKQAGQQEEDKSDNRLVYLVMMLVIGPAAIVGSVGTGYYLGVLLGLAFILWGVWETPEIHPYLKLIINWKSRKQVSQIKDSSISGSNIVSNVQAQRDVNIELGTKMEGHPFQAQRELAVKIYTPVRKEFLSWLEFGNPSFIEWERLNKEDPYWANKVPEEISDLLWHRARLARKAGSLNFGFWDLVTKASFQARDKVGLQHRPGSGLVSFRIFRRNDLLGTVYLKDVWLAGKSLKEFVSDFVEEHFPGLEWELDLQIDGFTVGDTVKAYQFADEALSYLEKEPQAIDLRKNVKELRDLSTDILSCINEELARD